MAEDQPKVLSPAGDAAPTVALKIVSPSPSIRSPIEISDLPATLTIAQLKQRIRDSLSTDPTNDQQRLIHRGRLVTNEDDTLEGVLGNDLLRDPEPKTIHLVLKDHAGVHTSHGGPAGLPPSLAPTAAGAGAGVGAPSTFSSYPNLQGQPAQPQFLNQPHGPAMPARAVPPTVLAGQSQSHGLATPAPIPDAQATPPGSIYQGYPLASHHRAAYQQHREMVSGWMNQMRRGPDYRQVLGQQQRERAAMGLNGLQDQANSDRNQPSDSLLDQNSPNSPPNTRVTVRQGRSPNDDRWSVTIGNTVIYNPQLRRNPGLNYEPAGLQASIASNQPASNGTQSSASVPTPNNNDAGQQLSAPETGSGAENNAATPDPSTGSSEQASVPAGAAAARVSAASSEVYIVSSPEGPRALLMHGPVDAYYTPFAQPLTQINNFNPDMRQGLRQRRPLQHPQPPHAQILNALQTAEVPTEGQPEQRQPHQQPLNRPRNQQRQDAAQGQAQNVAVRDPHNVVDLGAAGFLGALWPHMWLLIRLSFFIWWFTSPDSSWGKWLGIVSLAAVFFLINTGLFDNAARELWQPIQEHLRGILPMGNHQGAAENAARDPPAREQRPRPDPAQTAARLVAQRRNANHHWISDLFRRMERAGLLFLASIAPGLAEQHIAHVEAEERAERDRQEASQRQEAEAAAAAEAEASSGAADGADADQNTPTQEESRGPAQGTAGGDSSSSMGAANSSHQQNDASQGRDVAEAGTNMPEPAPLIDI